MRSCLLLCTLAVMSFAQQALTIDRLAEFIHSSHDQKLADKDVAAYLAKVTLSQRLLAAPLEEMQVMSPGPRTRAALEKLANDSINLQSPPPKNAPPPKPTGPAPPTDAEKAQALREAREWAMNYSKSLPNFICAQVTNRSIDQHYQTGGTPSWSPLDRFVEQLTYLDHREDYKLIEPLGKSWEKLGGSMSRGEWGTLLQEVFDPASDATFHWLRWGTLRGNLTHVFEYRIDQPHSKETIEQVDSKQQVTPAFHGLIYVQKGLNVALRLTVHPEIPADFPIQDVDQTLDYGSATINGAEYFVPLNSEVTMRDGRVYTKNEIQFRKYQKYGADTTITFDTPDTPLSDDQKKEQPLK